MYQMKIKQTTTTNQQRAQCVLWYAKFESVKRVQREFRREYGVRNVPKYESIMRWYRTFAETGSVMKKYAGGPRRNPEREEAISEVMARSPTKKMWTEQQKVQCVLWFAELKSVTSVQGRIRREWNVDPPSPKSIYEWDRTLRDRGSLISKTGKHPKIRILQ
ncbi:hypothetical protein C0J52_25268 [Blattella germanica]|nr:hypothetical protein C0J52_25268 [Blattella germanica]